MKAKGGPRVAEWDRGNRLRGQNPAVWAGDAGYQAALVLRFGPKYTSATAVNAVADLKQRKQEAGYRLVYDTAIMSHFGAGLREDISKVILGAANPRKQLQKC